MSYKIYDESLFYKLMSVSLDDNEWTLNCQRTLIYVLILYLYSQAMCKKQQGWNVLVSQGNGTVLMINYSSTKNHLHRLKGCLSSTREYFSLKTDANSEN